MDSSPQFRREQEACHAMLVELGKQRRSNDARLAEWVRRGTRVEVHRLMAKADMAQYLVDVVGIDPHTAQEWKRVGRALAQLPKLAAAMERGEVQFSQGKEVTRVATPASCSRRSITPTARPAAR